MKRLLLIFLVLALLVIIPFLIWGDSFSERLSVDRTVADLRGSGAWAWLVGVGLLVSDLFLPIPGTVIMSALGLIYGFWIGGLLSASGSILSGLLAYGLCQKLGRGIALRIAGESGLEEGERIFHSESGGWLVALSRWMPVLPEVIACLAGLSSMPFSRFFAALCAGSLPLGFVFAHIGVTGQENPGTALLLSALLPPVIWTLFRVFYFTKERGKVKTLE